MENCLIVTSLNYPENRGISQLAEKLTVRGLRAIIISLPGSEADSQVKTIAMLAPFYSKESLLKRSFFAKNFWWNPTLLFFIFSAVRRYRPTCIFVREPNFLLAPLIIARVLKIPLYLDIRENPEVQFISNKGVKLSRRILSGPAFIKRTVLKIAFRYVQYFFCVSSELRDLISLEYGVPINRMDVLPNYPSRQFLKKSLESIKNTVKRREEGVKLIHAGSVSVKSGLQNILPALAHLKEAGFSCSLTVVGNGEYTEELRKQCSVMSIEDRVLFLPAVDPLDLPGLLARHDVGVCSNQVDQNSLYTLPGKLFEYMAAGLAIFSNNRPTVANIINEAKCGVVYENYEANVIAEKLLSLVSDSSRLDEFGINARTYLASKLEGEQYDLPAWVCKTERRAELKLD